MPTRWPSAARTLDLTGVLAVLDTYRKIAEIAQRQGPTAHRRMLEQVERLERGENVPTVRGATHKAELDERLGRCVPGTITLDATCARSSSGRAARASSYTWSWRTSAAWSSSA
jgi:hypothetical protein